MGDSLLHDDRVPQASSVSSATHKEIVTVVLTAENHLGFGGFGQHPHKRDERQQLLRHAFQQATDFAVVQGVDFFIQAGDLFSSVTPDERDRSFVAARLAQLKQAGVRAFAVGGLHDTPVSSSSLSGEAIPSPQMSYASLGALHYFPPLQKNESQQLEPVFVDVRGVRVGLCALGIQADQDGDPLADMRVSLDIEGAAIRLLILHAPIDGLSSDTSVPGVHAVVARSSIEKQDAFSTILAGYHHVHSQMRVGKTDVVVAGATQHIDFRLPGHTPGFVFLGLGTDGVRWCNHISVDSLGMKRLVIQASELWSDQIQVSPTELILERLRSLCAPDAMIQLCFEGRLTRSAYHQLDLNLIRRYGEEHCFALAIDDSALSLLAEVDEAASSLLDQRFSLREELSTLADEWIAATSDPQEQKALRLTKEELLLALDEAKNR